MRKLIISFAVLLTACNTGNNNNNVTPNNNGNGNGNNQSFEYANTFTLTDGGTTYKISGPGIDSAGNDISNGEYKALKLTHINSNGSTQPVSKLEFAVGSPYSIIYDFYLAFTVRGSANQTTGTYTSISPASTKLAKNIAGDGIEYYVDSASVTVAELIPGSYGKVRIKGNYQLWLSYGTNHKTVNGTFDCKEAFQQ